MGNLRDFTMINKGQYFFSLGLILIIIFNAVSSGGERDEELCKYYSEMYDDYNVTDDIYSREIAIHYMVMRDEYCKH